MRKHSLLIAAGALLISTGIAAAQSQTPRNYDSSGAPAPQGQNRGGMTGAPSAAQPGSTGTTGAPSSTNPQAGGNTTGQAPREVPESGGAPSSAAPNPDRR